MADDFIKVGEDIFTCANEFLSTVVIKDINLGCQSIIEEIKAKYADARNEGEEYESASEASDENPDRREI